MKAIGKTVSPTKRPRSNRPFSNGLSDGARFTSVVKVLALTGVLGWILYIGTLVLKGMVNREVVGNANAPSWKHSEGKGSRRYDLRTGYRQLNMIGFENDAGAEEGWKTCRTYKEEDLIAHKKVGSSDYPSFCLPHDSIRSGINSRSALFWLFCSALILHVRLSHVMYPASLSSKTCQPCVSQRSLWPLPFPRL